MASRTNEWWDASRSDEKKVSSVEDERYQLVDIPASSIPANAPGAPRMPRNSSPAHHHSISVPPPWATNSVSPPMARPESSASPSKIAPPFFLPASPPTAPSGSIPPAASSPPPPTTWSTCPNGRTPFNSSGRIAEAEREANVENTTQFFELVGRTPAANSYEFDFAKALIKGENLGQRGVTDLLTISLSANDIQGHRMGPDSDSENQMILALDSDFDKFFTWLDQNIGLNNVWLALSADHGIAPITDEAAKLGMNSAMLTMAKVYAHLEEELNQRHSPGAHVSTSCPAQNSPTSTSTSTPSKKPTSPNKPPKKKLHHSFQKPSRLKTPPHSQRSKPASPIRPNRRNTASRLLPNSPAAYTRLQMAYGQLPQTELGRELAHSYAYHGNWFVMLLLGGYQMEDIRAWGGTTHFSPWSYDRHVPLAFYGAPSSPASIMNVWLPLIWQPRLPLELGINFPSAAVGRVLTVALQPEHANQ